MKAMNPKAKKITKIVVDVIFWVFFAFALAFTVLAFTAQSSTTGVPTIGNKAFMTVKTDSMDGEGGFKVGDLIVVEVLPEIESGDKKDETINAKREALSNIEVGQSITFKMIVTDEKGTHEAFNTHKVIEITPDPAKPDDMLAATFHTQGINVALPDAEPPVGADVLGVWTGSRVKGLGSFITFLQPGKGPEHLGFPLLIILPLAGFFAYEVVILVLNVKKLKGDSGKRTISKAEEELIKQQAVEEFLKKQEAEKKAFEEETLKK